MKALNGTLGSSKEFRDLLASLGGVQASLNAVELMPQDPTDDAPQIAAIAGALRRGQQTVESFLERYSKYKDLEDTKRPEEWSLKVKLAVKNIRWALCQKEEVNTFTKALCGIVDELGLLVATLQV
jgi:ADP-ribosylglycohydrolase